MSETGSSRRVRSIWSGCSWRSLGQARAEANVQGVHDYQTTRKARDDKRFLQQPLDHSQNVGDGGAGRSITTMPVYSKGG